MKRLTREEFECLQRNMPWVGPTESPDLSVNEVLQERRLLICAPCECHESGEHYETTTYGRLAMYCYLMSETLTLKV